MARRSEKPDFWAIFWHFSALLPDLKLDILLQKSPERPRGRKKGILENVFFRTILRKMRFSLFFSKVLFVPKKGSRKRRKIKKKPEKERKWCLSEIVVLFKQKQDYWGFGAPKSVKNKKNKVREASTFLVIFWLIFMDFWSKKGGPVFLKTECFLGSKKKTEKRPSG